MSGGEGEGKGEGEADPLLFDDDPLRYPPQLLIVALCRSSLAPYRSLQREKRGKGGLVHAAIILVIAPTFRKGRLASSSGGAEPNRQRERRRGGVASNAVAVREAGNHSPDSVGKKRGGGKRETGGLNSSHPLRST